MQLSNFWGHELQNIKHKKHDFNGSDTPKDLYINKSVYRTFFYLKTKKPCNSGIKGQFWYKNLYEENYCKQQ